MEHTPEVPQIARIVAVVPRSSITAPERFRDYVRKLASERGFPTMAALARAAGADESSVSRWLGGQNGPSVNNLRRLAPILGVRLGDLMVAAGMATPAELGMKGAPPPPRPPLPAELQGILAELADPQYSDHQKRVLLRGVARARELWRESNEVPREPRMRSRKS